MKNQYATLSDFAKELDRIESSKQDYLVPNDKLFMREDEKIEIEGQGIYGITDYAHDQLADKLQIPRKYYNKMIEKPGLRSLNVNAWWHDNPVKERNLVRTLDGNMRAYLSDRFKPIDNLPIFLTSIIPALEPHKEHLDIRVMSLSTTKLYLQFIFKNLSAEIRVGETVRFGLTISNSEVGAGSVNAEEWMENLRCLNGSIHKSLYRKYHIGKRIEEDENYHIWQSDTLQKELEANQLKLRDVLTHALTFESFNAKIDMMKKALGDKIVDAPKTIENITKRFNLSDYTGKVILQNMIESGDPNRYGLFNAITALAHNETNPDNQYQYEKIGGSIIDLSPTDWSILNAA